MRRVHAYFIIWAYFAARSYCQEAPSPALAPAPTDDGLLSSAPPQAAPAMSPPAPPVITYAPERSFSQWVDDLPDDPVLLIGFIISLLSGVGFLFVMYSVLFELVMGIPYKGRNLFLGSSMAAPARSTELK